MTVPRMVALLIVLAGVGLAVVALRAEQSIIARRIQLLQYRQIEVRRQIWTQEMELARLRSLKEIRQRAPELGVPVTLNPDDYGAVPR